MGSDRATRPSTRDKIHAALPPRPVVDRFVSRCIDLQGFGTVLVAAFIPMTSSDAPYRTW
jgi:hypothetical protein